ncbi:Piso0_004326 [Millerozyma farinosa CBS 7064]|uniref:Piso0_004326 protein n=1 Tax=Pichia sorbitophila (strain ATCC MYA-4447 / BCRC 22081 / CBS 7064 / NBRC 10061 / NRRL Y-12695) TaxID=559304 RepID=G8Y841_PICSO|nr:Piso0_004326 [Millerozyma farinosa CBS 7064]CCE84771.1 Piso0_004326 [Millerozyma farinosa CBS 7064]
MMSRLTLEDLGEDIICSNIAIHLSPADILSLALTSHSLFDCLNTNDAFHLLYSKRFGSKPTPLNLVHYDWKRLYNYRSSENTKFFTWGSSSLGRLGYTPSEAPLDHVTKTGIIKNVHTPTNVSAFNGFVINDISAGGFSFHILANDGELYFTGASWKKSEDSMSTPGPLNSRDFALGGAVVPLPYGIHYLPPTPMPWITSRAQHHFEPVLPHYSRSAPNPNLTKPPEDLDWSSLNKDRTKKKITETNFITKLFLPANDKFPSRRIISISSGREHIIALDNYHNILTWDTGCRTNTGVHLLFDGMEDYFISKISAGWNISACYAYRVGIIVWYTRDPVSRESYEDGTTQAKAHYLIIPGTDKGRIIDFHAGCDFVLFIKDNGQIYCFTIEAHNWALSNGEYVPEESFPVIKFNEWLLKHNITSSVKSTFTKISGCYHNFAIFTSDGMVLLGNKESFSDEESNEFPVLIPDLQKRNISHVAMGDYHNFALTDDGELLVWGTESNNCGCLGVGDKDVFLRENLGLDIVSDLGHSKGMKILKPQVVRQPTTNGKWLAVTAAGWQSGGIYVSLD